MGCGFSQFTEDEQKFFQGKPFLRDRPSLCDGLLSESSFTKLVLQKALHEERDNYTLKTDGGEEYVKILTEPGKKKIYTMKGDFIATVIFSIRYSEVNAVDAAFNLPHVYIYTTRPMKDGQEPSDQREGDKPLYIWARVHKTSNLATKFEVALAEFKGSPKGQNLEKFGYMVFSSTLFKDGRMEVKKGSQGACRIEFRNDADYSVTVAPCVDPVLMVCTVMSMESLKDR
mmetsp:Transcript_37510/g.85272  ORF Transcript_37510/g.85272 Transcript_37510/m.85272 type:complete len:229 (-) Transcript_37510:129-815(-)